jgi:two-component system LytT family response regulator
MRVLVADDEVLARRALANLLSQNKEIDHFELASDAIDAIDKLGKDSYDILLLDINMPEVSGIELLDRLNRLGKTVPSVVFVTAHHEFAIKAFERSAVDYVLKPFSNERMDKALHAALRRSEGERAVKLMRAMPQLQGVSARHAPRVAIKSKGRVLFINPEEVVAVRAEGNYVLLERESGSYLLREAISAIAEKLQAYGFVRIHRSILVNSSFVEEIQPCPTGEYRLRVKGGREFMATRSYKKNLKSLAQVWAGTDPFLSK